MSKGFIKAAVLLLIFVISAVAFGNVMNYSNEDLTMEMAEAMLPVISVYDNGTEINELHGYASEMNAAYMRDTITPIAGNRIMPVTIQTYQTAVDHISYEIRSLDASRLIANAEVSSYQEQKGKITAELTIQNLLEAGQEYLLIIKLESGERTICYYTRIMEAVNCYVSECVEFALNFNETTFNEETVGTLATYMEKTTEDNTTLQFVSLNSSLKQIGWGEFKGERLTNPVPSIKEITDTYNVIVLEYVLASIGENGESEYYNVEEYYRVRYTSSRTYLLNFERTMEQIFRGENNTVGENAIGLGIRSKDVEYKANGTGSCVAFVQEGELWSYSRQANTMAKVFSFRGYEGIDNRENYGEHEIKIVGIDEAGSVDYIVYGYMNRGIHEGQVGMAVYHYDSLSNTNEERLFIPSVQSYEVMKSELGQLMYVNENDELFLMVNGSMYGINLETLKVREIVKNLSETDVAISKSNSFVAWRKEGEKSGSDIIHVMNLSSGKTMNITAEEGTAAKPLGFMEEDFVYGIARTEDIVSDAAGNTIFPMYQVQIVDVSSSGKPEILKTYEKSGYFVSGIRIEDYTMYLDRIQYNGTAYVDADQDMIMNREGDSNRLVAISTSNTGIKQTEVQIVLPEAVSKKAPKLLTPKETILEEDRSVALNEDTGGHFYVYVKGDVICATDNVVEAISRANEKMGVVIGEDFTYVWKRSRKTAVAELAGISMEAEDKSAGSVALCMNAMLQKEGISINVSALLEGGETPKTVLHNTMKDEKVYDLTGCNVEEVLYYISCGSPVFAMTGNEEALLIVGYDASSIIVYDTLLDQSYRKTMESADELFESAGNIFFTYLPD